MWDSKLLLLDWDKLAPQQRLQKVDEPQNTGMQASKKDSARSMPPGYKANAPAPSSRRPLFVGKTTDPDSQSPCATGPVGVARFPAVVTETVSSCSISQRTVGGRYCLDKVWQSTTGFTKTLSLPVWSLTQSPIPSTSEHRTEFRETHSTDFPSQYSTEFPTTHSTGFPPRYSTEFSSKHSTDFPSQYSTEFPTTHSTGFPPRYSTEFHTMCSTEFLPNISTEFHSMHSIDFMPHHSTEFPKTHNTDFMPRNSLEPRMELRDIPLPLPFPREQPEIFPLRRRNIPDVTTTTPEKICNFCKTNGEMKRVYLSHKLMEKGKIVCPVLRRYICPLCGATGDNAHTMSYCPFGSGTTNMTTARTPRKSCGCRRACRHGQEGHH